MEVQGNIALLLVLWIQAATLAGSLKNELEDQILLLLTVLIHALWPGCPCAFIFRWGIVFLTLRCLEGMEINQEFLLVLTNLIFHSDLLAFPCTQLQIWCFGYHHRVNGEQLSKEEEDAFPHV